MRNWHKPGAWNVLCEICGQKYKSTDVLKNWKGQIVCREDFEHRNQQDFLRGRIDKQSVEFARPEEETPTFVSNTCDLWSSSQMADFGVADCMYIGGNTSVQLLIDSYTPTTIPSIAIAGRAISGVY